MTSQDPIRFENYPPPDEPGTSTVGVPDGTPSDRFAVTPYYPPPPPPEPAGPARRDVLKIAAGVGMVGLFLAAVTSQRSQSGSSTVDATSDPYGNTGSDGGGSVTMDVGDYSADLPDGWILESDLGNEAIATNGDNRVLGWAFSVRDSDKATDLISTLVKNRLGAFTGTLSAPLDDAGGDSQHAQVNASGKVGKKAATLLGQLWIDSDANALLVVQTLVAKAGSDIAGQAEEIINGLSGDF